MRTKGIWPAIEGSSVYVSLIAPGWVKLGFCPEDHTEANSYDTRKTMGTGPALGWIRDKRGLKVKHSSAAVTCTPLGDLFGLTWVSSSVKRGHQ